MNNKRIIVIGGGQAAVSFLAKFANMVTSECKNALTLVTEEPDLPYQRPPLSKKYATAEMTEEQLFLRTQEWYDERNVSVLTETRVESIDTDGKSLTLSDGKTIDWDKLILTTGSRARPLPQEVTQNLSGIYELRSKADADKFGKLLVEGNNILIVGGGYIGLEAAAVCASKGMNVTLIEAAERILQRVACPETSAWFKALHESKGVRIIESVGLEGFSGEKGSVSSAKLSDGTELSIDAALIGIGIIPNDELAQAAGLETNNGILVNEHCQTSHPDIYAAGDCAIFQYDGQLTRLESVQNAIDQAECAAKNMAGEETVYTPYPWFWSDQYDVKLQIAGLNRGYDQVVVREGDKEGSQSHFYFKDGSLLAVDAINEPKIYMICKRMLEAGKNISPEQAADKSVDLRALMKA